MATTTVPTVVLFAAVVNGDVQYIAAWASVARWAYNNRADGKVVVRRATPADEAIYAEYMSQQIADYEDDLRAEVEFERHILMAHVEM